MPAETSMSESEMSKRNVQRIRWHSRRGMLELDLILVPFAEQHFETLAESDQDRYVKLLESEDQDLLAWLLEHTEPTDADTRAIIQLIRERHGSAPMSSS